MNIQPAISWDDRDDATRFALNVSAGSEEARRLVEDVLDRVILPAWPDGLQKRSSTIGKHRLALAVIFGELQRLGLRDTLGKHGMGDSDFVGAPFGRDVFRRTVRSLEEAGLLLVAGGYQHLAGIPQTGRPHIWASSVTTFALTGSAIDLLERHGVVARKLKEWREHWRRPETSAAPSVASKSKGAAAILVELKDAKTQRGHIRPVSERRTVDWGDPRVASVVAELKAHNEFVAAVGVEGASFHGLKRVFNCGDVAGFAWQWGGRFASLGPAGYESERKTDRLEVMRLGREPVVEIDLRAAHLTILYALAGEPLDPTERDPYLVGGLGRELVKAIVVQAIGRGDVKAARWSEKAKAAYAKAHPGRTLQADIRFRKALTAVIDAHPVLHGLEAHGGPVAAVHVLNFHEAEIMSGAMKLLREGNVASLPVHDCLIVPARAQEAGKSAISTAFSSYIERITGRASTVVPALTVEQAAGDL